MPQRGILRAGHRPGDLDERGRDVLALDLHVDTRVGNHGLGGHRRRDAQIAMRGLAVLLREGAHQEALLFFIHHEALALLGQVAVAVPVHVQYVVAVEDAPDDRLGFEPKGEREVFRRLGILRLLADCAVDFRQLVSERLRRHGADNDSAQEEWGPAHWLYLHEGGNVWLQICLTRQTVAGRTLGNNEKRLTAEGSAGAGYGPAETNPHSRQRGSRILLRAALPKRQTVCRTALLGRPG